MFIFFSNSLKFLFCVLSLLISLCSQEALAVSNQQKSTSRAKPQNKKIKNQKIPKIKRRYLKKNIDPLKTDYYKWGSPYYKSYFIYSEVSYATYLGSGSIGDVKGVEGALGLNIRPFGIELRYVDYQTTWSAIKSPLDSSQALEEPSFEEDFEFDEESDEESDNGIPTDGAEESEELRDRDLSLSGTLNSFQLLFTVKKHLWWLFNLSIKAGPIYIKYEDSALNKTYSGYTLAVQGGVELEFSHVIITANLSGFSAILHRPQLFGKEKAKWRELPIRLYMGSMGLIFRF